MASPRDTGRSASQPRSALAARRRFALGVAALLALVPAGYVLLLARAPGPSELPAAAPADAAAPAAAPAPRAARMIRIAEVVGSVEVRQGGGGFAPARVGELLGRADAIRTADGRARLAAEDLLEVELEPATALEVEDLAWPLTRLRLDQGLVLARVRGGGGARVVVAAAGSDATAISSDGTFAVSATSGAVAVGARAGEVEFRAAGRAVLLRPGQQSVARGGAPEPPAAIPSSLFLKIDWPAGGVVATRRLAVTGRTTPGSVLRLGGERVQVEADGRFRAVVRLREGRNRVRIDGADVGGNRHAGQAELVVDTTAPDSDLATQQLWDP